MFSYEDFRATQALRAELLQWLHSDIGIMVMRVMRDKYRAVDVPVESEALVSARILSQYHGAQAALDDLERLSTAPFPDGQLESTFESSDTDHDRMPENLRPIIKAPPIPEEMELRQDDF